MNLRIILFSFAFLLGINSTNAEVPNFWNKSSYAIECTDKSIRDILNQFGSDYGVIVEMTERVGGACDGWLRSPSAVVFLDSLAIDYQLTWYLFNDTLYVSNVSENDMQEVSVGEGVYQALKDLGLVQKKFGWGNIDADEMAIVSGPKSYLRHIASITSSLNAKSDEKEKEEASEFEEQIFVIPLKFASVTDRETRVRDRTVLIPGVATILNRMLDGTSNAGEIGRFDSPSGELLEVKNEESKFATKVEADPRTNSLIIRSKGRPIEYFKAIVDTLDIPQSSVELDLVVVDISREKMSEIGVNLRTQSLLNRGDISGAVLSNTGVVKGGVGSTLRSAASDLSNSAATSRFNELRSNRIVKNGVGNFNALLNVPDFAKFYADIQLLAVNGDATVIANTSLLAMENQPASIDLSTTFFIRNSSERVANSQPVTIGTLLNVTPHAIDVEGGKKIKLAIEIEDGSILPQSVEGLPLIRRSQINTRVVVPEGNTLILGGHRSQNSKYSKRSVPGLNHVPVVKHLFSSTEKETKNTERLYILTPRIAPEKHNVQDYLTLDEANATQKVLENIDRRWNNSTRVLIDKNLNLLKHILAKKPLPSGYRLRSDMSTYLPVECRSSGLNFSADNRDVIYGTDFVVYRFKVENRSSVTKQVYEHSCFGEGLISVVNSGTRQLNPGQSTDLLVSVEIDKVADRLATFY
ncbi:MAG: type III secretion system outer membrane ring subunit SctC [Acidiferrobacterales bacterium]|nr:type III secretion system outer membrane ring subunit SctC [Acidiferrobacterales bacterium]